MYRPDCNAEGGCHAIGCETAARGIAGGTIYQHGARNHTIIIITTWSHDVSSFYKLFACGSLPWLPWGALIKSQILFVSHDRVDKSSLACVRTWERTVTPISPWGRDWKCTFPGKYAFSTPSIVSDGYSTGNAPPSGNNDMYRRFSWKRSTR